MALCIGPRAKEMQTAARRGPGALAHALCGAVFCFSLAGQGRLLYDKCPPKKNGRHKKETGGQNHGGCGDEKLAGGL